MDTVKLIRHDMPVAAVGNDWILSTDSELLSAGEQQIGGKAMGLTKLKAAGARVPPWFSITAICFSERLAAADLLEPLRKLV